jgi:hypothetical protein
LDALCLLAGPHSGTDRLREVLAGFAELAPHGAVFAPDGAAGISPEDWPLLHQRTGIDFAEAKDFRLSTYAQSEPGAWLDALAALAAARGRRVTSFALGRDDLGIEASESAVLSRPGVRALLVVRKQIDSYVERCEAEARGGPVTLDADRFEAWLGAEARWYAHWKTWLGRRFLPAPVLRYETDIDQPAERVLRRFAGAAAQLGITLRPPALSVEPEGERAAPPALFVERVANWPAFSRELSARGIERRAFGYPL